MKTTKIYVTKYALVYRGNTTGISEHEVPNDKFLEDGSLILENVGCLGPRGYTTTQPEALKKVKGMIVRKRKALSKQLSKLSVQEDTIDYHLNCLGIHEKVGGEKL